MNRIGFDREKLYRIQLRLKDYVEAMGRIYEDAYLTPRRDLVETYILGTTGRRIGEVLRLTTEDILWDRKAIAWHIEKKRKPMVLVLPASEKQLKLLDRYIRLNGISWRLFDVSRQQAWWDVKRVLEKYGLVGWRPHDLRHAFALKMLLDVKNIELARRWLAHSDYRLLRDYVDTVGIDFDRYPVDI